MWALPVERLDVPRDPLLQVVDDELDEPPRLGRVRGDALTRHRQPPGTARRDEAGCALRAAAAGEQAEVDLWESELRVAGGDPEVARKRDLETAAETEAVNGRDHRDRRLLDQVRDGLDAARTVALPQSADEAADVGAGRERTLAAAAQDDCANVVAEVLERAPECLDDPCVDGVDRRVVEPDGLDHAGTPPRTSRGAPSS